MVPRIYQLQLYRQLIQVIIMHYTTHHHLFQKNNVLANNRWLRRIVTTGFAFFLIKGLIWIAAGIWILY